MSRNSTYIQSASKAALNLASRDRIGNTELKSFTAACNSISISTTMQHWTPNTIASGAGPEQRAGREINVRAVVIGGFFTSADYYQHMRVVVSVRRAGYSATPNVTLGALSYGLLSNLEEKFEFKADDYIGFPAASEQAASTYPTIPYTRTVVFKNPLRVRYNVSGNISDNCPIVSMVSDSSALTHPTFTGYIRFFYTDE